jgi:hypothetical protein
MRLSMKNMPGISEFQEVGCKNLNQNNRLLFK